MASGLRTSQHLTRLSRQTFGSACRSRSPLASQSSPATRLQTASAARCRRQYATVQPNDPKPPKQDPKPSGEKAAKGEEKSLTENSKDEKPESPGKSAPGMEHLHSKGSPLQASSNQTSSTERTEASKLSPEDEITLNEITQIMKSGMPKKQYDFFLKALEVMKKEGAPDELKEILKTYRGENQFKLATAAQMYRIMTRLARKASEIQVSEEISDKDRERLKKIVRDENMFNETQQQREQREQREKKEDSQGKEGSKKSDGSEKSGKTRQFKLDYGSAATSAVLSALLLSSLIPSEASKDITWQEFKTQFLDKGLVDKLTVINQRRVQVKVNREAVQSVYPESQASNPNFSYYFNIGDLGTFERHLDQAQDALEIPSSQRIPVNFENQTSWMGPIVSFGPTILLIGYLYWVVRRSSGGGGGGAGSGIFGMGKSRARQFNHETDIKIGFRDVAGMDEAKTEIMEFVSFLKEPGIYQKLGAKIPRGAILSGPPGTGKTLLAKATAGESKVPFFSVSGSEFVEMFVGVGASRVRDMFSNARKNAPCIIFIDEIDAIGKSRGKNVQFGGNDEREATLNQILTEMDGFNTSDQVVVLAGTNRADVLDKALLRPGRFDRHISIDRPTMEGRKQIFGVHLRKVVTHEDMEHLQGRLAALTPGFAGADIANCVNEAALIAARRNASSVGMVDFEAAIERVIGGLEKKSLVLNPQEKRTVAYHEAGHAICGWYFKYADPLLKVSIIPRGQGALGYAQYLPDSESYLMSVNQLMDRMAMTLGGRVSEELHFDTVTSGASDDFNKVTRMATAMVTKWGMSDKVGYLYFEDDPQQQLHKPFSEDTAKAIDAEVRRIVGEAYQQCRELLVEKKKEVGLVAEELLKKEMLARDDLVRILGPRPFEDNKEFSKYFGGGPGGQSGEPASAPDDGRPTGGLPPLGGGVGPAPAICSGEELPRREI